MKAPEKIIEQKRIFNRRPFLIFSSSEFVFDPALKKGEVLKMTFLTPFFNRALAGKTGACSYLKETNL